VINPVLWNLRARRRGLAIRSAMETLVASPHDITNPLTMPIGCLVGFSNSAGSMIEGDTVLSAGSGATLTSKRNSADEIQFGVWIEKGAVITLTGAPSGVTSLHWQDFILAGQVNPVFATITV
jgi:hypothetical protein